MGVISNDDFMFQQALLGSGYDLLVAVNGLVMQGLQDVANSDDPVVTLDLIGPYNENEGTTEIGSTSNILAVALKALEKHIESRTGQTLNDYLYVNGLKVGSGFAALSWLVGIPISTANTA